MSQPFRKRDSLVEPSVVYHTDV